MQTDRKTELVSVIVPVYNVEAYLDRCVESIVNQTHAELEIILVDDGSPDRCGQMCDIWAARDARIRVLHRENAGAGLARNAGLAAATGEYVCFVDSDDYIAPEMVEQHLRLAEQTGAEVVVSGKHDVDREGCVTGTTVPTGQRLYFAGEDVQSVFLPALVDNRHRAAAVSGLSLSFWAALFSMERIRRAGWQIVSERQYYSEDSYSLLQLYAQVKAAAVLPQACYYYCCNDASLSRTYRVDKYDSIRQFYHDCRTLVRELHYGRAVEQSVSALHLSFTVAAMKQIAAADMKRSQKRGLLKQILQDETLQQALADSSERRYGRARTILFRVMKCRAVGLCHMLLSVQNMRTK